MFRTNRAVAQSISFILVSDQSRNCAACQQCMLHLDTALHYVNATCWAKHTISQHVQLRNIVITFVTLQSTGIGPIAQLRAMSAVHVQLVLDQSRNCAICQPRMYWEFHYYWCVRSIAQLRSTVDRYITMFLVLTLPCNQHVLDQTRNCAELQ